MAVNYTNDSYDRCIAELRARYIGRGVSVSAKRTAKEQEALDSGESTSFGFSRISGVSNEYRSGVYNGSKYMTSDDFIRYFRNRSRYNMPLALRNEQTSMEEKSKETRELVGRRSGRISKGNALTVSESSSKEGNLITRVESFVAKWFPVEPREGRETGARFKFPTAAVSSMAAFALSLVLIVSGSVMVGNASGEVGTLNTEISQLEAEQTELQSKLDLKYNIQDIEQEAARLGMIKNEYADKVYLEAADEEKIEIFEQEDKDFSFAALLSAFGIEID